LRSKKWWWNLFSNALNLAVVAAWQLHRELHKDSSTALSHLDFRRDVTTHLLRAKPRLTIRTGRRAHPPETLRITEGHYLEPISQGRCRIDSATSDSSSQLITRSSTYMLDRACLITSSHSSGFRFVCALITFAARFGSVSRHSLSETLPYFDDPSNITRYFNSPSCALRGVAGTKFCKSVRYGWSPFLLIHFRCTPQSLRFYARPTSDCPVIRFHRVFTIAPPSTVKRHMLTCGKLSTHRDLRSILFLGDFLTDKSTVKVETYQNMDMHPVLLISAVVLGVSSLSPAGMQGCHVFPYESFFCGAVKQAVHYHSFSFNAMCYCLYCLEAYSLPDDEC
ncbi:hypothetical protein T07_8805, partial [Trichinella nelsoni]